MVLPPAELHALQAMLSPPLDPHTLARLVWEEGGAGPGTRRRPLSLSGESQVRPSLQAMLSPPLDPHTLARLVWEEGGAAAVAQRRIAGASRTLAERPPS